MYIYKKIKTFLCKLKNRNLCRFEGKVDVNFNSVFEGKNRLTNGVIFFDSYIGYASYVGERSVIKNTKIGRYSCIASDVSIILGEHPVSRFVSIHPAFYSTLKQSGFTYVTEQKFSEFLFLDEDKKYVVDIGNDVWIGANVKIIEGTKIGDGAIIVAGAVVTKDVEPYSVVGGVPAKIIKYRFNDEIIKKLLIFKWWDKSIEWIEHYADRFDDVETFFDYIEK